MPWQPFDQYAERYDRWFDEEPGRSIFPSELAAIRLVLKDTHGPQLEVGVGTGRFASALDVTLGLDPSREVLRIAQRRGVEVVQGIGERLPFEDDSFGAALFIAALCFLDDAKASLREAIRVLGPSGSLVVADVIADSPWGRFYQEQKRTGHPFYAEARFFTLGQLYHLLRHVGLNVTSSVSTLVQPPDTAGIVAEQPIHGLVREASFVCLRAELG